jgi:hypothetical protein
LKRRNAKLSAATAKLATIDCFDQAAAPSRNSPVGSLMRRILDESPDLTFEQAKQRARTQLLKAAAKRNDQVTTPKQDRQRAEQFRKSVNAIRESGKHTHPSEEPRLHANLA